MLNAKPKLIVVEGAKTPAGGRDRGDPTGEAEEAPGPPAGKRSAWNGNQPFYNFPPAKQKNTPLKFRACSNVTFLYMRFSAASYFLLAPRPPRFDSVLRFRVDKRSSLSFKNLAIFCSKFSFGLNSSLLPRGGR